MAFTEVTVKSGTRVPSEPFSFEETGQVLEGKLVDRAEIQTEYGPKKKYVIQTADGSHKSILGSFQLNEKLALVADNALVRITFKGREKTKNGKVKIFSVAVDT